MALGGAPSGYEAEALHVHGSDEGKVTPVAFQVDDAAPEIKWELQTTGAPDTAPSRSGSWRGISYLDWRNSRPARFGRR